MSHSKLGPIPDDHFENEPGPPDAKYAGTASPELVNRLRDKAKAMKEKIQAENEEKS